MNPDGYRPSVAIKQGEEDQARTHKDGRILSVQPSGEGDADLIRRLNKDKKIYLSRTTESRNSLLTARHYKYIRKMNEIAPRHNG